MFDAGDGLRYNQMVVVKDITLYSHCEHHMTPFFGSAHIAYVPGKAGLVGLSKLARVVDIFARRLQTQERITTQIADCLSMELSDHIGVLIEAQHMCMISRGVQQPHSTTITTALRGDFFHDQATRAEFLQAVRGNGNKG
jgi:GTP cyclohydrolase I